MASVVPSETSLGPPRFLLVRQFPYFVLMEPDWICVPPDELVNGQTFDGGGALDALLSPSGENGLLAWLTHAPCDAVN